jgi:F0F1-type ATP synthase membrane subunit b/b'
LSPTLANFLFEAANFLLLAAVLGWVLFKPVRRALDAERKRHEEGDQEINRLRAEAEALVEEDRHAKQTADKEIEKRRQEILTRAKDQATQLLEDARKRQRAEHQRFEQELEAARSAEAAELASVVGGLAADAVRKLLETLPGPSIDNALIRAACKELEGIPAEARKSAQIESARTLDDEAKEILEAALGTELSVRIVSELGAGVRITTPAGQIDATALSLARLAGRTVSGVGREPEERPRPGTSHG